MHRRMTTGALAVTMAGILALSACSSKDSDSDSESGASTSAGASTGLTIAPLAQIDTEGKTVEAASESDAESPAGDGKAKCDPTTIAMAGALTGADAALGINIRNGAQLAVDEHNSSNPDCKVTLKTYDTEGDPQKATQVAPQIVNNKDIIGLIGPAFSGETKATGGIFSQAGLVSVTASATNPALTGNGWKTFYRGLANDDVQGPAVANYLTGTAGKKKICVIKDDTEYGAGLAKAVIKTLGDASVKSCEGDVKKGERDFSAIISTITGAKPDAVFYAGYYSEAAPLAEQLKRADSAITFVSADGSNDPQFTALAGNSAKGAVLTCPCGPAPDKFKAAYESKFKQAPGVYSVEAYDLATILMKGIGEGKTTRADLLSYVKDYKGKGLAREYEWSQTGELKSSLIWVYEVK
ncbi:ABC transporter substrate-binding protein [Gordonia amarae]|uniref:ABC transporter substrate-binding protein n=2 Tax=Gordonia amarae TaxID=36821 RepID=A0A857LPX3_9ACTN|nr:branched-chain amino acid ABC transporter substrate-binding protein [Gordonia amarae]QHN17927.1 ABC transporter substrate-binding protein [Gordonia amarae]QHN22449.1 ABC transporter substrate-binding protein [Gordonia amarae]QHN31325.1 ABC transporter substrate-binding protein [Gordonia amarae]QHN40070.1 ABC transporter substrate-binding protein [Gordonia amarae]GAB06618.1 putative branched-chain amino acid ABC transporter substrate binding protein [Gordonia amarae NBRC 15530]